MKSTQTTRLVLVLAGIVVLAFLITGSGSVREGLEVLGQQLTTPTGPLADRGPYGTMEYSVGGNAQPTEVMQGRHPASQSAYTESALTASELLPKGQLGASWAKVNPASMSDLKGQNFLDAGYHTNTVVAGVSQVNRNPSWDIRRDDPNPQASVGPFINTTIGPDPFKRGLDA